MHHLRLQQTYRSEKVCKVEESDKTRQLGRAVALEINYVINQVTFGRASIFISHSESLSW